MKTIYFISYSCNQYPYYFEKYAEEDLSLRAFFTKADVEREFRKVILKMMKIEENEGNFMSLNFDRSTLHVAMKIKTKKYGIIELIMAINERYI